MLKNNNQVAVNLIYHRMLKQNKIRNRIVILAIILTTFMFTAVFTLGFSMAKNLNQMQLRLQGTKSSVYLEKPSEEQLESAKKCKNLHAAGVQIDAEAVSDATGDYEFLLQYYDKTEFQNNLTPAIDAIQGAYPGKENEIMMAKNTLEALGITEPELHQTVTLYMNGEKTEFVLSGWFNYFGIKNLCLVSKAYVDKQGYRMEDCGRISMSAKEGKQEALRDELEKQVKLRAGQDFDVTYDVQE